MRRIISREKSERKEKVKRRTIGITLLSIMVLSVFGAMIGSIGFNKENPNQVIYKETVFSKQQERWFFEKNQKNFFIMNSPEELTEVSASGLNSINSYFGYPLYISSTEKSLESQIYYNFQGISSRIQPGCLENGACNGDFPIKTCEDYFIIIEESEQMSIIQEQNCVFIRAQKQDLQKALDSFILKVTEID